MEKKRTDAKAPARKKKSSKKRRRRRQQRIERIVFIVALLVFIISAASLIKIGLEYKKGTDTYDEVLQAVVTDVPEEVVEDASVEEVEEEAPEEAPKELRLPYVDLDSLRSINKESTAWIYFPDTQINYPVVHGADNEFYLNHMIDGSSNGAGTLFVEMANNKGFVDRNTVIYGHNMKNGSMFGILKSYGKAEYYDEHPCFYLYTDEGVFQYNIFSVRVVNETSDAYTLTFSSDNEYWSYIDKAFRTSMYDTGVAVTTADKIVTLSTCTSADTDRLIIQAVKGEQIR